MQASPDVVFKSLADPTRRAIFERLSPHGEQTVRMEQYGFRPEQEAAYKGANYGWQKFIDSLERVVAGLK